GRPDAKAGGNVSVKAPEAPGASSRLPAAGAQVPGSSLRHTRTGTLPFSSSAPGTPQPVAKRAAANRAAHPHLDAGFIALPVYWSGTEVATRDDGAHL